MPTRPAVDLFAAHRSDHNPLDGTWPTPLGVDAYGRGCYTCGGCGAEIPDGCQVFALRDKNNRVIATRAERADGTVAHDCAGTRLPGHNGTDEQRVKLRQDDSFATETGA